MKQYTATRIPFLLLTEGIEQTIPGMYHSHIEQYLLESHNYKEICGYIQEMPTKHNDIRLEHYLINKYFNDPSSPFPSM
jgi:hypothetical protein